MICGEASGQVLLAVLFQHSCLRGLLLNQITVAFPLPCCVIFQADRSGAGARCAAVGTSVPVQPHGRHMGRSGGGGKQEEKVGAVLLLRMGIWPCT